MAIDYLWGRPAELMLEALAQVIQFDVNAFDTFRRSGRKRWKNDQLARGDDTQHRSEAIG